MNNIHKNTVGNKRQQLHQQIRSKHINEFKSNKRKEILLNPNSSYNILKDINLTQVIWQFKHSSQITQQTHNCLNKIFLYASSSHSDHLFFLFDEEVVSKLQEVLENIGEPYTLKVLWTLTNYTNYDRSLSCSYIKTLERLWSENKNPIMQLVLLSLSNLTESGEIVKQLIETNYQFLQKIFKSIQTLISENNQNILLNLFTLIRNIMAVIHYQRFPNGPQVLCCLGEILEKQKATRQVKSSILATYRQMLVYNLDQNPQIILQFNLQLQACFNFLSSQVDQGINEVTQKTITLGLQLLKTVFAINIPDCEQEAMYLQIFEQLFQTIFCKIFNKISIHPSTYLNGLLIQVLENMCLEVSIVEYLVYDYIYIVGYLFIKIKEQNLRNKNLAIKCLCNCLTVSMNENNLYETISEMFLQNKFNSILISALTNSMDVNLLQIILTLINAMMIEQVGQSSVKKKLIKKLRKQNCLTKFENNNCEAIRQLSESIISKLQTLEQDRQESF